MTPSSREKRHRAIKRIIRRSKRLLTKGERASQYFSRGRVTIFLSGFLACLFLYKAAWFHAGNLALIGFLILFLTVTQYHSRLKQHLHRLRLWQAIKETHLARLRLDWSTIPAGSVTTPEDHTYASDLDITGTHSLFNLLDVTFSTFGQTLLAAWLLNQNQSKLEHGAWAERQALVRELHPQSLLRDRLILETQLLGSERLNGDRIQALLQNPVNFPHLNTVVMTAGILCLLTLCLFLAWGIGAIPGYWILSFGSYVALYFFTAGQLEGVFGRVLDIHHELEKLHALAHRLEQQSFHSFPHLQHLTEPLTSAPSRPSTALRTLARLCHGLSVKAHPLIHLILNAIVPWDLILTRRLTTVCDSLQPKLPIWLDRIATIDAAASLANFAYLNPTYQWPVQESVVNETHPPGINAKSLGHPLIPPDRRITNDLNILNRGRILLVTGSNMSGKSTFLRTIGVNVCLAQAGAPVCAEEFSWSWLRLFCCIRVTDSLDEGLSYFYAEVKRLKVVLDAVKEDKEQPVLFLIDEIYKGTNNRERLLGSEAFIQALRQGNGLGLVTTHDLELARLEGDGTEITNVHFQETVEDKELRFDYQLRPGPCPTTNALRIMAREGLPIPEQ